MEELRTKISKFMRWAYHWIKFAGEQQISLCDELLLNVVNGLESVLKGLGNENLVQFLLDGFQFFLTAYQEKDYVLAADYLETAVIDVLKNIASEIMSDITVPDVKNGYSVEITSVAAYTLAKEIDGRKIYLHSNRNPYMEGYQYLPRWYQLESSYHCLAGLGMAYHVYLLGGPLTQIDVYEEDAEVIRLAEKYSDVWIFLTKNKNIRIIHDPGYQQFIQMAQAINEHKKEGTVCVYFPSIQTIQDEKLRKGMKTLFLQLDNQKRWGPVMALNFQENTARVTKSADDLREKMEGKRIFIIAGGPSLDKNIHLFKKRNKEDIVLTVGISLRRCLQEEVRPDFAIITDPKASVHGQIEGVENCGVPLILLSTCYAFVARDYQGEKYLACQQGYEPAEELAEKNHWMTVETGGSVTTTALDIAIRLGAESIVFAGLDLAFTGGRSHQGLEKPDMTAGTEQLVEDIYGEMIPTSDSLNLYRRWIERRIAKAKEEGCRTAFYDASEGGARVEGTIIVKLADLI